MKWCLLLVLVLGVTGCQTSTFPDPNDPVQPTGVDPTILLKNLEYASNSANARVFSGEISPRQAKDYVSKYAAELTSAIKNSDITPRQAWMFGKAFMTAREYDKSRDAYETAVRNAPNEDRKVNDSLQLAVAYAHLRDIPKAIQVARSVFNASPNGKAPILPAVLYELVPAGQGKGHDVELAKLLEEAVQQHQQTIVNPKNDPGQMFLIARPHHIRNAWRKVIELYLESGHPDLAEVARKKALDYDKHLAQV